MLHNTDDLHDSAADDRVRDADNAVGALVMPPPPPSQFVDPDRWIEQATGLRQPLRIGEREPGDRHRRAISLHALREIPRVPGMARIAIEPVGAAVPHKAAQKALAG